MLALLSLWDHIVAAGHMVGICYVDRKGKMTERVLHPAMMSSYEPTGNGSEKQSTAYRRERHGLLTAVDMDKYRAALEEGYARDDALKRSIRSFKARRIIRVRYAGQDMRVA